MSDLAGPRPAVGFIGVTLDDARKTHFFQWFNLEPAGASDGAAVFKPSGPNFRNLVSVTVRTDADERIRMIDLVVARSFIEDPRQGMFAADIAKSFLEAALGPEDRASMQHLIDTIAYGASYAVPILAASAPGRPTPEIVRNSAPYLVWLDKNSHWRRPSGTALLEVQNVMAGAVKAVRLAVSAP